MTSDPRLESYLSSLEQVLKPFPVSDRAEIVTEIKSHVLSTLERDPQTRLDTVLAALGEPETVANRYLMERGLKPTQPPISPVVKWLVIGFLGTFAMLLIFAGIIVTRFTPLLHVDDSEDRVSLFGGMIEVDGKNGKVLVNGSFGDAWEGARRSFDGSYAITKGQSIAVKFGNGKINVVNSDDSKLSWNCSTRKSQTPPQSPTTDKDGVALDLSALSWVKCELSIPENTKLLINGSNGKIEFNEPRFSLAANITNGKVGIHPDEDKAYRYDVGVTNGMTDSFTSSDKADAYTVSIHVANGKISHRK